MKSLFSGLILIFLLAYTSCSEDDGTQLAQGDYFPVQNLKWSFQRTIGNAEEFSDFGTITLHNVGPVLADGKLYHRITGWDGYIDFEVRREGSEYFSRKVLSANGKEYKFLDTKKTVGESWSYLVDEYLNVTYTILSKESVQKINGTVYRNVITIGVNYSHPGDPDGQEVGLSAKHVYVEGKGEVYSFVPYPLSRVYGDVKSVRVNYH